MRQPKALGTGLFAGAACAACCAPPIIATLGLAAGFAATAAVVFGIAAAVAIAILAATALAASRQRTASCATDEPGPVSVSTPVRRTASTETTATKRLQEPR